MALRRLYQVDVPESKWDAFEDALVKLGIDTYDVEGEDEFDER